MGRRSRSTQLLSSPVGGDTRRGGVRLDAHELTQMVRGGTTVLDRVSLSVRPGELVAIVGGSGAGKTTLLDALAGVRPARRGRVLIDGVDLYANLDTFRTILGYVPQDDIIHAELPLERTLRYAAELRLPPSPDGAIDAAVRQAMETLGLGERAHVRVAALSGGQRKRASIGVELLTDPRLFFLDEPTSGLDPATDAELVSLLRRLADGGATVIFTTHAVQDLAPADRIVFLARGGRLAFDGDLQEALAYFDVPTAEAIYERLGAVGTPERWAGRGAGGPSGATSSPSAVTAEAPHQTSRPGPLRQLSVLTRRTFETLVRNKLTLAILLGSPAMVVAMLAILFRPHAFDLANPSPSAMAMILFWVTFGAFFFGLTYGLLQVVTERAILRREHLVGLRLGAYLLSKVAVLLPFLVLVQVVMLVVLRALDRLPPSSLGTYASVSVTLTLLAAAALGLGLLTSAAVTNASQATLALPMLCFPAVLFSGAILPVHLMAGVGAAISAMMPARWAWEALGHDFGVRTILAHGGSPLGPPLLKSYGGAGLHATSTYWLYLAVFVLVLFVGSWVTLVVTCRRNHR